MGNLCCEKIYVSFKFLLAPKSGCLQSRPRQTEVPVGSFLRLAVWCEGSLGAGFFPLMTSAVLVSTLSGEDSPRGCTLQKLRPHTPPTAQASQAALGG